MPTVRERGILKCKCKPAIKNNNTHREQTNFIKEKHQINSNKHKMNKQIKGTDIENKAGKEAITIGEKLIASLLKII